MIFKYITYITKVYIKIVPLVTLIVDVISGISFEFTTFLYCLFYKDFFVCLKISETVFFIGLKIISFCPFVPR